jgi:hypothetical protein
MPYRVELTVDEYEMMTQAQHMRVYANSGRSKQAIITPLPNDQFHIKVDFPNRLEALMFTHRFGGRIVRVKAGS